MIHDPAECGRLSCRECDIYTEGEVAAHLKLRAWELGAHESDCGCEVCGTARVILRGLVGLVLPK